MLNYDDRKLVKRRLATVLGIVAILTPIPFLHALLTTHSFLAIVGFLIVLPAMLFLLMIVGKDDFDERTLDFAQKIAEDVAIFSMLSSYCVWRKGKMNVLMKNFSRIYVCFGNEDEPNFGDKLSFLLGRFARDTETIDYLSVDEVTVIVARGSIVIPSPKRRDRVVRGVGYKFSVFGFKDMDAERFERIFETIMEKI